MKDFSRPTQAYILGVISLAALLSIWHLNHLTIQDPLLLLIACIGASLLQSMAVFGSTARSTYSLSWVIYAFMLIIDGPSAALITVVISHIVEWMADRTRLAWYIQAFNVSNFIIAILLSGLIIEYGQRVATDQYLLFSITLTALALFTLINHLLVAWVVMLARGQSFSESGIFGSFTLFLDFTLLCLGFVAAIIWQINPLGLILVTFIAFMLYRTLNIPALERKAEVDSKTQLYNARYFTNALAEELVRCKRFKRPMSLIMADLDFLRDINNNYGHLAGDVVLQGVAEILQEVTREYDIVSRFGGEEFSVLLPETTLMDAYLVAERVRKRVAEKEFHITTSVTPIRATMSFGVAGFEDVIQTPDQIIHNADLALYQAKGNGRNQTCVYESNVDMEQMAKERDWSQMSTVAQSVHPTAPVEQSPPLLESEPIGIPNEPQPEEKKVVSAAKRTYPAWLTNLYVALLFLFTTGLTGILISQTHIEPNWPHLILFAGAVLILEAASIEIYAQDSKISTTASLLVAGTLLFGLPAPLMLGATIALVPFVQTKIKISRLIFNSSNHILGGLVVFLVFNNFSQNLANESLIRILGVGAISAGLLYLTTTGLVSVAISLDSQQSFKSIWLERFRWLAPYYIALGLIASVLVFSYTAVGLNGLLIIIIPLLMLRYGQKQYIDHTEALVRSLQDKNVKLIEQADQITRLSEDMLMTLARSLDLRDPYVLEHSNQVSKYAVSIAQEMSLPATQVENIRKAGLLHDIGKLGVPEHILFKPTHLTAVEYEQVKKHVTIGAELIQGCASLEALVPFILHHHEWYDGNGYPHGLKEDEIPLEARILSVADAVEAMASDRPYKAALSAPDILAEVERCAGTQFDPVIVKAFGRVIAREGREVIINSTRHVLQRKNGVRDTSMYPPHY